ncbi:NepR family anti-sigma factor [Parasphingorhabdus sp. JC815]|uniref:NepR family anti-sigma factor n=1 Tax=Parasphingorhabdus sp. JC815 TaxID=3232140 RepID=UPI003458F3C1
MPNLRNNRESDQQDSSAENNVDSTTVKNLVEVKERLGFGLRSMYRSVLEEPLPADMLALLDKLEETEGTGQSPSQACQDRCD